MCCCDTYLKSSMYQCPIIESMQLAIMDDSPFAWSTSLPLKHMIGSPVCTSSYSFPPACCTSLRTLECSCSDSQHLDCVWRKKIRQWRPGTDKPMTRLVKTAYFAMLAKTGQKSGQPSTVDFTNLLLKAFTVCRYCKTSTHWAGYHNDWVAQWLQSLQKATLNIYVPCQTRNISYGVEFTPAVVESSVGKVYCCVHIPMRRCCVRRVAVRFLSVSSAW